MTGLTIDTDDRLPEGIYFRNGQRPGKAFGIMFLALAGGATSTATRAALTELWTVYDWLRAGVTPELPGHSAPGGDLTYLLGYGPAIFARNVLDVPRPAPLLSFTRPATGQPALNGARLPWSADSANVADCDLAIQVIANTQLATRRAILETHERLSANGALRVVGWHTGFQRDDGRSWLGFHDGVSNLRGGNERKQVIIVDPDTAGPDEWIAGGTYLAYLRIAIDVRLWRSIDETTQERLVGRAKGSGCPLVAGDPENRVAPGCPTTGDSISVPGNNTHREPPSIVDATVGQSHVQRANHHRPHDRVDSGRMFRQGYEYLEPAVGAPGYEAGLNFVSFQNTPARLVNVLTQPNWLGGTNFGGPGPGPIILTTSAAGFFVIPPDDPTQPFPAANRWTG